MGSHFKSQLARQDSEQRKVASEFESNKLLFAPDLLMRAVEAKIESQRKSVVLKQTVVADQTTIERRLAFVDRWARFEVNFPRELQLVRNLKGAQSEETIKGLLEVLAVKLGLFCLTKEPQLNKDLRAVTEKITKLD